MILSSGLTVDQRYEYHSHGGGLDGESLLFSLLFQLLEELTVLFLPLLHGAFALGFIFFPREDFGDFTLQGLEKLLHLIFQGLPLTLGQLDYLGLIWIGEIMDVTPVVGDG